MDEKVVPEGISLKDLCQLLRQNITTQEEPEGFPLSGTRPRSRGRGNGTSWQELLFLLLRERTFFCLQKVSDGGIIAPQVAQSQKVLDYFLERLWEKPITGSRVGG